MTEHVARVLCRASCSDNRRDPFCPVCDRIDDERATVTIGACEMWPSFMREAAAAIEGVRDYARLEKRNKPRGRSAVELLSSLPG